ncbi:MAG TPA: DUF58 domain-containing protein [Candidatus Saccharimonadales bacterium]|nr:DUF58 domain-containing protein [Candidatus Saccharimonadales bacterium]
MSLRQQFVDALRGVERGAWLRLFIAIFGLSLAFASALLSTASREAGDVLATAVFASSALLLSAVVAFSTVPYLARQVVGRRVRDALNYEVTREGLVYLALTLLIGVAALNTGNNLLFIVVAAMLGAVLVSGIVSAIMISGLEVELHLPHHVFAGQNYAGAVLLRNRRWIPAFSISVVPPIQKRERPRWRWQRTNFVFPPARTGRKALVRWPDLSYVKTHPARQQPPVFEQTVYFPYLPGRHRQSAELNLCFPQRGRYAQRGIGISTRFPFSFLSKTRTVALNQEVLVFPSVEPTDEMLEVLPMITGELETNQRGRGSDLYRIRDYEPEDSARHVDWKATAKSGELKVREYTREDERRVCIIFDNPAPGVLDHEHYERCINLAASISWHFFQENTELSFAAPSLAEDNDVYSFLEYLATCEPKHSAEFLATLPDSGRYNIVITACPRGQIPTELWESSYVLFAQE